MGVPGSKIWSNLQLLSLFESKYLKCDDCYDDNDGSQVLRAGNSAAGDVIKTLTKAKKKMKREKYENKRKHCVRIFHPKQKQQKMVSMQNSFLNVFTQIIFCFVQ